MISTDPAFPLHPDIQETWMNGLTKREYFAAMALNGFTSNCTEFPSQENCKLFAKYCFLIADAMLAEAEK